MEKVFELCFVFALVVLFALGVSLLLAYPFMWLWNGGVDPAFSFTNPIKCWQAFCLMFFLSALVASSKSS